MREKEENRKGGERRDKLKRERGDKKRLGGIEGKGRVRGKIV